MPDLDLVEYIRTNAPLHGDASVRAQLLKDGFTSDEIDRALFEARVGTKAKARGDRTVAILAVLAGGILLMLAAVLSKDDAKPAPKPAEAAASPTEPSVFRGHYGYMVRLPPGYKAVAEFSDAEKRIEIVYIVPTGTDPSHFQHEGLYSHFGILKLESAPRRVPQGLIGIDTLKDFAKNRLAIERAAYTMRDMIVSEMPAFIVTAEKPFQYVRAYAVGEKNRFILTGGSEGGLFTEVLSSLAEVSPNSRPGK